MDSDSDASSTSNNYVNGGTENVRKSRNDLVDTSSEDSFPKTAVEKTVFGSDSDESSIDSADVQVPPTAPVVKSIPPADLFGSDESSSDEDLPTAQKAAPPPSNDAKVARKALILSDDDDDDDDDIIPSAPAANKRAEVENLLGGVSSEDDEDGNRMNGRRIERGSDEDDEDQAAVVPAEEDEEPERVINVELPYIKADLGRNMKLVKITNFLSVEPRPFDPATYEDEAHEDEVVDEQGSTRLKLKVENTIRWRSVKGPDGEDMVDPQTGQAVRQSNARFVRWSDGTMSLHLGQEIFDVHPVDIRGNDNFLYIRQGQGLQGQGIFTQKLSFRPHSTDSFTHKKITLSMATKSQNKQNVKILPIVGEDPEQNRRELQKREEERLRATLRRENQQRRMRERQSQRELGSSFLENDDEENTYSLGAIKQKFQNKSSKRRLSDDISSESDGESDISDRPSKQKRKAKVISDEDD